MTHETGPDATATTADTTADTTPDTTPGTTDELTEHTLIEEVSIDGMCGVY